MCYQPQVADWKDHQVIDGRMAFTIIPMGAAVEAGGAVVDADGSGGFRR